MLGVLITLAFCAGMVGLGRALLNKLVRVLDPLAAFGVSGMIALASAGTLTLFVGLMPGGLQWGVGLFSVLGGLGLYFLFKQLQGSKISRPESAEWLFVTAIGVLALFALVSVLAPSDMSDWDTLSHHLASVKIWIQEGQITHIPFMHQSNFPFAVDNLYLWGLQWGGQSGAKAFSLAFYLLGIFTVFGLARQLYGRSGAWWSALLFATVPVIVWESGTAYIDVAHGLFAGLGVLFAGLMLSTPEDSDGTNPNSLWNYLWLSGACLGFAAGTKYTGLQTLLAVGAVLAIVALIKRKPSLFKQALLIGALALAIGSPWYIKNQLWNGNPVYPFFHSVFKGKNWDDRRAAIYQNEQRTFGVGRDQASGAPSDKVDPSQIGHAVLGLAYQPGRFTNPGQTQGYGDPLSGVGIAVIVAGLLLLIRGRRRPHEVFVLATTGLTLLMWFVLSQQSRYITSIAPPLAILAGGLVTWPVVGVLFRAAVALQAVITVCLFKFAAPEGATSRFDAQIQAAIGAVPAEKYLASRVPFYNAARYINDVARPKKVALYDEVFGYLLDVPYFWANPGHSTLIPYDTLNSAEEYVASLRDLGFSHVYLSSVSNPQEFLGGALTEEQRSSWMGNWELKWKVLIGDAVAKGLLRPVQQFPRGILFELAP